MAHVCEAVKAGAGGAPSLGFVPVERAARLRLGGKALTEVGFVFLLFLG